MEGLPVYIDPITFSQMSIKNVTSAEVTSNGIQIGGLVRESYPKSRFM